MTMVKFCIFFSIIDKAAAPMHRPTKVVLHRRGDHRSSVEKAFMQNITERNPDAKLYYWHRLVG